MDTYTAPHTCFQPPNKAYISPLTPRLIHTGTPASSSSSSDPCQYANDGQCDVPEYCFSGDYADCGTSSSAGTDKKAKETSYSFPAAGAAAAACVGADLELLADMNGENAEANLQKMEGGSISFRDILSYHSLTVP